MAKPPYLGEDSIKYYKPRDHALKAKGLSFFASIFSLFIYISIFYFFKLSPYSLFNNHIFWFFMSNTLILIIAADYGAFSASKQKQDLYYEDYVKHSQTRNHVSSSYVPKYEQVDKKCIDPKYEIVAQNDPKKPSKCSKEKKPALPLQVDDNYEACEEEKPIPGRILRRSKSDRSNRVKRVVIDESMNTVRTMKVESEVEEENEFSTMTNEELNRRVEDFIQKFNRQIRLQATRNVYQI